MYNIDFIKLILWLVPVELQQPILTAYVRCLIIPVMSLYAIFMERRAQDYYNLNHNSQVCYMRKALNDRFDPDERRIVITNGFRFARTYFFTRVELRPVYVKTRTEAEPLYIRERSEYADTGVDFLVRVPAELLELSYEIKALIDYYRLGSKRFKVIFE